MRQPDNNDALRDDLREQPTRPSNINWLNLGLRAVMETAIVAGLAYWGYETGSGAFAKVALAIAAPVLGFGFWGVVDFHQAGRAAEALRLAQELLVTGLVALGLWDVGQPILAIAMALISIVYHVLVYASGERLLKSRAK